MGTTRLQRTPPPAGNMFERSGAALSEPTSTSLLSRAKAHEQDAWRQLVTLYGPLVYQWCRRNALQAEDARDVGQEVFQAVAGGLAEFRRERAGDSFHAWLWGITRNKIFDCFRRQNQQAIAQGGSQALAMMAQIPEYPPDDSSVGGLPGYDHGLELRAMEWVQACVEPRTWEAFRQMAIGRPAAEIAAELGMNVRAIYDANYRVRRRIRRQLADLLELRE